MADEITFDDCCRTILSGWRLRRDDIAPVLRDYHRTLLTLMTQEFGIAWEDDWEFARRERLPALVSTMPEGYAGLNSPFSRYLEYKPRPGEMDVLERHRGELEAAEGALKQRWVALFRDLLLLRWPEAASRTTRWARLEELGLGKPVDELDFF